MIDIRFTVTEPEYLEAQQIFVREQRRTSRWRRRISWAILLAAFVVLLSTLPRPLHFKTLPPYLYGLAFLCLLPLCIKPLQRRNFKKRFATDRTNLTDAHLVLDRSGYRSEVPGIGSGIAEWRGMSGWFEGEKVFMLRSGYHMRIVPKASLTEVQLEEVRSLLTEQIGPVGASR